jgi:hypothetical protein
MLSVAAAVSCLDSYIPCVAHEIHSFSASESISLHWKLCITVKCPHMLDATCIYCCCSMPNSLRVMFRQFCSYRRRGASVTIASQ